MSLSGLLPLVQGLSEYQRLLESLRDGTELRTTATGIIAPAQPYLLAGLAADMNAPIVIVSPREESAYDLYVQLMAYSDDPARVLLYPAPDTLPYERIAPDPGGVLQRLKVLAAMSRPDQRATTLVTSARGLMQIIMPPEEFGRHSSELRAGDRADWEKVVAGWVEAGYRPSPVAEDPGTFARRGGIIDVFPATANRPARIDLFGDEIESLRLYDPATQRSQGRVDRVSVTPPTELPVWRSHEVATQLAALDVSSCRIEVQEEWERLLEMLESGNLPEAIDVFAPYFVPERSGLLDHVSGKALLVLDRPEQVEQAISELEHQAEELHAQFEADGELPPGLARPYLGLDDLKARIQAMKRLDLAQETDDEPAGIDVDAFHYLNTYGGQVKRLVIDVRKHMQAGQRCVIVTQQADRLRELFEENDIFPTIRKEPKGATHHHEKEPGITGSLSSAPSPGSLHIVPGRLPQGWQSSRLQLVFATDAEVFGWAPPQRRRQTRKTLPDRSAFLSELTPGEFVVHIEHGIARYDGLVKMEANGGVREYLLLSYAAGDRLYVPIDQIDRVAPYVGAGGQAPMPTRLGTPEWSRAKRKVKKAAEDLAKELLDLYATREANPGHSFAPDTVWQNEMEESFPYVETDDQLKAIDEVKVDMEKARPMDRLICGDVGYGKTEVALRAAFKAVMDGKQVAVLVPTTVLAQQHFNTFTQRLQAFPVQVEMLSRFRSPQEQKKILPRLSDGGVDILVGTHRILQKDVTFRDLGLVIVDEEQRFGVKHKEHLKQLRREVDVLTLTATPIPRTLHMSLAGVRDMSVIETPPDERLPIKTYVTGYDERLIREAILRELDRGGQVFFVHNRVQSIPHVAHRLQELVPEARFAVGHGQMEEKQLEKVMMDFVRDEYDVLVCTTIIESGLDIPNANTLIVDDAANFGLAQLYQLRGRVGRGANRAYAYFLHHEGKRVTSAAYQRLDAIQQAAELGAGFRIAMKDMEIRGAGNLLGPEQHGHVAAVGFDLYCRLLGQAVEERKGNPAPEEPQPVTLDLPLRAYLPEDYVTDGNLRLRMYQRLASSMSIPQVIDMERELVDRFGPLPQPAKNLVYLLQVRSLAREAGAEYVGAANGEINIRVVPDSGVDCRKLEGRIKGVDVRATPNQLRIVNNAHGAGWQDVLTAVLEALAEEGASVKGQGTRA